MRTNLKNAYEHVNGYGLHVCYPYGPTVSRVWNNVRASLAHHGDLKKCDFTRLPYVDPDSRQVYPRDIRAIAFYIGNDLYAMYATPLCTDENVFTGKYQTFLFNTSAPAYLGSVAEALYDALSAQETERAYIKRTISRVVQNLDLPKHVTARGVHFVGQAHNAIWNYQLFIQYAHTARSALAEHCPKVVDEEPKGYRDLVPPQFHTKLGM